MSSIVTCNTNETDGKSSETKTCKITTEVLDKVFAIKIKTKDDKNEYIIHISGKDLKRMIEMTSFMAMNFLEKEINASVDHS